jgi:hypothetical protein
VTIATDFPQRSRKRSQERCGQGRRGSGHSAAIGTIAGGGRGAAIGAAIEAARAAAVSPRAATS